jgi:hypothetical protein
LFAIELVQTTKQRGEVLLQALQVPLPFIRIHLRGKARFQAWQKAFQRGCGVLNVPVGIVHTVRKSMINAAGIIPSRVSRINACFHGEIRRDPMARQAAHQHPRLSRPQYYQRVRPTTRQQSTKNDL